MVARGATAAGPWEREAYPGTNAMHSPRGDPATTLSAMRIAIVGGGVFGLSCARELARRGHGVVLHEAATIPAAKASSHDVSKAIRHAYGVRSALYAPLAALALTRWRELEAETARPLLHSVGFAAVASHFEAGGFEHESALELAALGIGFELLERDRLAERFPGLAQLPCERALLDPLGGWLAPDLALLALRDGAVARGAVIVESSVIEDPRALLATADAVIVAAGPWLGALLPTLRTQVVSRLQHEWFFAARDAIRRLPVWSHDIATTGFYGFPADAASRCKIACHVPGEATSPDAPRPPDPNDRRRASEFVTQYFPWLEPEPIDHRGCCYEMSVDGEPIFDALPGTDGVFVAGGGSGHAFKFAPLLGEFGAALVEGRDHAVPREFRLAGRSASRTV
jgi:glycine/D-amino acid oxidase-like deaminating enzyme